MILLIDDTVCGKRNLIDYIEERLNSPYSGDNWDGFRDALLDLSWLSDNSVEIRHDSLPLLNQRDLQIYLEILYETERSWKLDGDIKFNILFPEGQQKMIGNCIQSSNIKLFNRMSGQHLRRLQLGFRDDGRLQKVYLLSDCYCFSIDDKMTLDYYPLTAYKMKEILNDSFSITEMDGVKNVQTVDAVSSWKFLGCEEYSYENGKGFCIRCRDSGIMKRIECYYGENQVFCCRI